MRVDYLNHFKNFWRQFGQQILMIRDFVGKVQLKVEGVEAQWKCWFEVQPPSSCCAFWKRTNWGPYFVAVFINHWYNTDLFMCRHCKRFLCVCLMWSWILLFMLKLLGGKMEMLQKITAFLATKHIDILRCRWGLREYI